MESIRLLCVQGWLSVVDPRGGADCIRKRETYPLFPKPAVIYPRRATQARFEPI